MKKIINKWPFFLFLIIFKNWLISPFLTASDWPHFFTETVLDFPLFPPAWAPIHNNGLGGEVILYALDSYMYVISWVLVSTLDLPWEIVYKIFIFFVFVFLSILSSIYLLKTILHNISVLQMITGSLLFTANTYILMVVGGGQVGVAVAYSLSPLILATFINLVNKISLVTKNIKYQISNIKYAIIAGLTLALQVMFDARIAYMTMIAAGLYLALNIKYLVSKKNIYSLLYTFLFVIIIPLGITVLLHTSWILPLFIFKSSSAQAVINQQTSLGAFKFFSFADFSQTLSLLHPNWPENLFGKLYFMKPEFLFLPILAFSSLLFLKGKQNLEIIFFVFLGLIGAFFAKGASEPFGMINELFYRYVPGMSMFRDPTKFYLLTALSYSILIPFSLFSFFRWLKGKIHSVHLQVYFSHVFFVSVIVYFIFLLRPVFLNQLGGTFMLYQIPQEYVKLKDFLYNQPTFFRTLWVPRQQRYNFYSYTHPAISASGLFKATSSAEILNSLRKEDAKQYLEDISVKYIIVPYDLFGDIFIKDRKYDNDQYLDVVEQLDSIKWLEKVNGFGKITVYKTPFIKGHFWIDGQGSVLDSMVSPTEYRIKTDIQKPATLIFAENYNAYWKAQTENTIIRSQKTKEGLNSFPLEAAGTYKIYFEKEKIYGYGRIIAGVSIFIILILLWKTRKK